MSDEIKSRKPRSPIAALKIINALRAEKGLPKIGAKPVKPKLSKADKEKLFAQVVKDLIPQALSDAHYEMNDKNLKVAVAEFEKRLKDIQGVPVPRAPYSGKPRGRKPKV